MAIVRAFAHRVFVQNLATKGFALALALITWWYVGEELTTEASFKLSFTVTVDPACQSEWRIVRGERHTLDVTLRGPRQTLDALLHRSQTVVAEELRGRYVLGQAALSGVTQNERSHSIQVAREHFEPLGYADLAVVGIDPGEVKVDLNRLVTRAFELQVPETRGTPAPGFQVRGAPRLSKPTALLEGPARELERLGPKVALEPVELAGQKEPVTVFGRLRSDVAALGIRIADPSLPTIVVDIALELFERELTVQVHRRNPEVIRGTGDRHEVEIVMESMVKLTIRGPEAEVKALVPGDIEAQATFPDPFPLNPEGEETKGIAKLAYVLTSSLLTRQRVFEYVNPRDDLPFSVRLPPIKG